MALKFGKKPARPHAMSLLLSHYLHQAPTLPALPDRFGNLSVWDDTQWKMLGNDEIGDCVFAGFAHQVKMWAAIAGKTVDFTDTQVISAYSVVTGFDPSDPSTDNGTDMVEACQWWKNNGFCGHHIVGFAEVAPQQVAEAAFIFGSVGVGLRMTQGQQEQFSHAEPWDITNDPVEGGHYVPLIGRNAHGNYLCITWGRLQSITPRFLEHACDEAVCQVSQDWVNAQTDMSPRGLKMADMIADMNILSNT